MIPKIIHYCWFGGKPLSELAIKCIESWKRYCPDYEIVQWNETNYDFSNKCRYVQEAYEVKKWAFVSDYARLDIVYNYGGVYLDTDVELLKSLDAILNQECFLAQEISGYIGSGLGFGAIKNNQYIKKMLDEYTGISYRLGKDIYDKTPCPARNTAPFRKMGFEKSNEIQIIGDCTIYPSDFFCPFNHRTKELNITENTIAIHYYNASWIPDEEKKVRAELNEYMKSHGKFSAFLYKNKREFAVQYPQKGLWNLMKFFVFKVKRKILYRRIKVS